MLCFSCSDDEDQEPFLRKDESVTGPKKASQKPRTSLWIFLTIAIFSIMVHGILSLWWIRRSTSLGSLSVDMQKSPILYSMMTLNLVGNLKG